MAEPTPDPFGNNASSGPSHDGSSDSEEEIPDPRNLDCVMIHHIINQEANNLLTLAHMRYSENVGTWRDRGPGPTAGQAVWYNNSCSSTGKVITDTFSGSQTIQMTHGQTKGTCISVSCPHR